eukprot:gene10325-11396_t
MREQQDKKGGGLMVIHKQEQNHFDFTKVQTKQKDVIILYGKLRTHKVKIILVYLSVIRNEKEKKINQDILKEIRRGISQSGEDELIFILGDFNGHIGIIGSQKLNYNGKIVLDIMTENNMILLNDTDKCKGTYTWSQGEQKCVIDFVLVNQMAYTLCDKMIIDEQQERFDLTDHNLMEVTLKIKNVHPNYQKKGKWEEKEYYKFDENSLKCYVRQLEEDFHINPCSNLTTIDFNSMIGNAAHKTLRATYRKRTIEGNKKCREAPWVTDEIRTEIKKRKKLNREKRNCRHPEMLKTKEDLYKVQKQYVQCIIKKEIQAYEMKITDDIRQDRSRGKKIWDNINKLRGQIKNEEMCPTLYDAEEQPLEKHEAEESIEQYWTSIYNRHDNNITTDVWNEENKRAYQEQMEQKLQFKHQVKHEDNYFPMMLREHFDAALHI